MKVSLMRWNFDPPVVQARGQTKGHSWALYPRWRTAAIEAPRRLMLGFELAVVVSRDDGCERGVLHSFHGPPRDQG